MTMLSVNKLSEITGLDRRTITGRLQGEPFKKEGRSHLYESKRALDILYGGRSNGEDLDFQKERARLTKAQADKAELELSIKHEEYVPYTVLTTALSYVSAEVVSILERLPKRIKQVSKTISASDLRLIEKEIAKARNAMASVRLPDDLFDEEEEDEN